MDDLSDNTLDNLLDDSFDCNILGKETRGIKERQVDYGGSQTWIERIRA